MLLDMNTSWTITWAEVAAVFVFFITSVWVLFGAYWKLMAQIAELGKRMESMERRNLSADAEAVGVKQEQQRQHTDIAVITAELRGVTATLARIEASLNSLRGEPRA